MVFMWKEEQSRQRRRDPPSASMSLDAHAAAGWGLGMTLRRGQLDAGLHFGQESQLLQHLSF